MSQACWYVEASKGSCGDQEIHFEICENPILHYIKCQCEKIVIENLSMLMHNHGHNAYHVILFFYTYPTCHVIFFSTLTITWGKCKTLTWHGVNVFGKLSVNVRFPHWLVVSVS